MKTVPPIGNENDKKNDILYEDRFPMGNENDKEE